MTDKGDEPMTDWEQRYRDLQAEHDRVGRELDDLQRRAERYWPIAYREPRNRQERRGQARRRKRAKQGRQ